MASKGAGPQTGPKNNKPINTFHQPLGKDAHTSSTPSQKNWIVSLCQPNNGSELTTREQGLVLARKMLH